MRLFLLVPLAILLLQLGESRNLPYSREQRVENPGLEETKWEPLTAFLQAVAPSSSEDDEETPCRILPPEPKMEDDIVSMSLWELLEKTSNELKIQNELKDVTLLLGNTGAGKTTLTQLMVGNVSALEVVKTEKEDVIIVDPENKIGRTTASRTIVPELVVDKVDYTAIYDCPGFSDNRGPNTDIATNFLLKKVTDHITSARLVFVVIYSAVSGTNDKSNFDGLAKHAVLFAKNLEKLSSGIGLIVTKAPNNDPRTGRPVKDETILRGIQSFLTMYKNDQETLSNEIRPGAEREFILKKIQFVNTILNEGRIWFMRNPRDCGPLVNSQSAMLNRQQLRDLITQRVKTVSANSEDFGYALADRSLLQISMYAQDLNDNITRSSSALAKRIEKEHQNKFKRLRNFEQASAFIREEFQSFNSVLRDLNGNNEKARDPKQFSLALSTLLKDRKYPDFLIEDFQTKLTKWAEYLDFFDQMSQKALPRTHTYWLDPFNALLTNIGKKHEWYEFLARLKDQLSEYKFHQDKPNVESQGESQISIDYLETKLGIPVRDARIKEIYADPAILTDIDRQALKQLLDLVTKQVSIKCEGKKMTVSGTFVRVSDFVDNNGQYHFCEGARQAQIFASEKVFIDRDIRPTPQREGAHELVLISPLWSLQTPSDYVTVQLDGAAGDVILPPKARNGEGENSEDGQPGSPGNPGYGGGRFFGISGKIENPGKLRVVANGGPGGKGQNGGNGGMGRKGRDIWYNEWPACWDVWHKGARSWFDSFGGTAGISAFEAWVVKYGEIGSSGGRGGSGGMGGMGGLPGDIHIMQLGTSEPVQTELKEGSAGSGGIGGEGGEGGRRGRGEAGVAANSGLICGYNNRRTVTDETSRGPKGGLGSNGAYSYGRKQPIKPTYSVHIWDSISTFKAFALKLNSPYYRNQFLISLAQNEEILDMYTPAGLAHDVLALEHVTLIAKQKNSPVQLEDYIALREQLLSFAKRKAATFNPSEKKILAILCATILSKINAERSTSFSSGVVTDVEAYLHTVLKQFQTYDKIGAQVLVEEARDRYADTYAKKMDQALSFISFTVNPAMEQLEREMEFTVSALVSEIETDIVNVKAEEERKKRIAAVEKMTRISTLNQIFGVAKAVAAVASLFGAQGAAIGTVVGTAASVGEQFALGDKGTAMKELPGSIMQIGGALGGVFKNSQNQKLQGIGALLGEGQKLLQGSGGNLFGPEISQNFNGILSALKNVTQGGGSSSSGTSSNSVSGLKSIMDSALIGTAVKQEGLGMIQGLLSKKDQIQKLVSDASSPAAKETAQQAVSSLDRIKSATTLITSLGSMGYQIFEKLNQPGKPHAVEKVADLVEEVNQEVVDLQKLKERVSSATPHIQQLTQQMHDISTRLESNPSASILEKFKARKCLQEIKEFLRNLSKDYPEQREHFGNVIDKLIETMDLLSDIYQQTEHHLEQTQLANYIADINSPNSLSIVIDNPDAVKYINKIQLSMQANILLGEYSKVVSAFTQSVFPFAQVFSKDFELSLAEDLPKFLDPEFEVSNPEEILSLLLPLFKQKVERLNLILEQYKAQTVPEIDNVLISTEFRSDAKSLHPFYLWNANRHYQEIRNLLAGQQVTLFADPEFAYQMGKSAVKFRVAEIQIKADNPEKEGELNEILKNFAVEMTHSGVSHYMYEDKEFATVGQNVTIRYSIERNPANGERFGTNAVYEKLKRGDLFLSPYTLWTVQLIPVNPTLPSRISELQGFAKSVRLELTGRGSFVLRRGNGLARNGFNLPSATYYERMDLD